MLKAMRWHDRHQEHQKAQKPYVPKTTEELEEVFANAEAERNGVKFGKEDRSPDAMLARYDPHITPGATTPAPPEDQPAIKYIIYTSTPAIFPHLQKVLSLHGYGSECIFGKVTFAEREAMMEQFSRTGDVLNDRKEPLRVLILSSVSTEGVNLPRATVAFVLVSGPFQTGTRGKTDVKQDPMWNRARMIQFRGRIWRSPQPYRTFVYYLVHHGVADQWLHMNCYGKRKMDEAFTTAKRKCLPAVAQDVLSETRAFQSTSSSATHFNGARKASSLYGLIMRIFWI